jgi:hypothetical protein
LPTGTSNLACFVAGSRHLDYPHYSALSVAASFGRPNTKARCKGADT